MNVDLAQSLQLLRNGDVVAIPTETVYGLAGRIHSRSALEKIFAVKQRPFFDPLIVHVANVDQARLLTRDWPHLAQFLADTFWPGPLTLILPKSLAVDPLITSGLETVGVRCPRHPLTLELIKQLGEPLAAPSANMFGKTSPTRAEHVEREFQGAVAVLDGGACEIGLESTVVQIESAGTAEALHVLRPGGISLEALDTALKNYPRPVHVSRRQSVASPGHLKEHYQPQLPLVMVRRPENVPLSAAELSDIRRRVHAAGVRHGVLKLNSDPRLAARELYHQLHEFSRQPIDFIVFYAPAEVFTPAWEAVCDRIERAASVDLA